LMLYVRSQFTTAKVWNQPKCPSADEWIKTISYVYTVEFHSAIKKNEHGIGGNGLHWRTLC
uniref:Uncharacterized protein n=1 Tax=Sciurus vulgaris TaxID=55149 RepID=A0A8D2AE51_SCIVU